MGYMRGAYFYFPRNREMKMLKPRHPRFEVECLHTRKNSTISLEGDLVVIYDTSRGAGNQQLHAFEPGSYSFNCETSEELYNHLYRKSLEPNPEEIYFIGYVNEKFQPIEEEEEDVETESCP